MMFLPHLPIPVLLRCALAFALFGVGWLGCACWVARLFRTSAGEVPSPDLGLAGGFALWIGLIVSAALGLPLVGAFSSWTFLLLPLTVALVGFRWAVDLPLRRWRKQLAVEAVEEPWLVFGLLVAGCVVWGSLWLGMEQPLAVWDTISYHQPISVLLLQEARYWDLPGMYGHINTFPKNGEFVGAWLLAGARWLTILNATAALAWLAVLCAGSYLLRRTGLRPGLALFLMSLTAGSQTVLLSLSRDAGNVDLLMAALLLVTTAASVDLAGRPRPDGARVTVALVAMCLCPGVKASGFLLGALSGLVLLGILLWKRARWRMVLGTVAGGCFFIAAFSSYWAIVNAHVWGNPIHPVEFKVAGYTISEGPVTLEEYIGTDEGLKGRTGFSAFWRSVKKTDLPPMLWGRRMGGWGAQARYLCLPLWPIALLVALGRRRWAVGLPMLLATAWLFLIPAYWWSRFSIVFVLFWPFIVAAFWYGGPGAGRRVLNHLILGVWILAAAASGMIGLRDLWLFYDQYSLRSVAQEKGRRYAIQQDSAIRLAEHRRAIYHWVPENLPAGSVLTYDIGEGGDHMAMLWRPEANNIVRNLEWPHVETPNTDYLLISNHELREFEQLPPDAPIPPRIDWADQQWHQVYLDGSFVVFQRESRDER